MATPLRLVKTRPTGNGRARGLVSSPESGRRIDASTYQPPVAFGDVVATYWVGRWDLRGVPPHTTELLNDPCVHFVIERGGPHAGARVVGVWTRLWQRTLEGKGLARGVKLKPGAVRAFTSTPAVELTNKIQPLTALFGDSAGELEHTVNQSERDDEALGALNEWLQAQRKQDDQVSLAVALVERISEDSSITTVEHLAQVAGMGPRALQRLFREYVGGSPKWAIRRNRLQEAALLLEKGEAPSLAYLAADLGYTDQAHLARDFKSAVGKSPSDFAASMNAAANSSQSDE